MKKIILSILIVAASYIASQASCIYEKQLTNQEFQIGIMLTWVTQIEENTSTFIIEKSDDGINFTNIGTITSAGNSNKAKDYNFLDVMASAPFIYYRLKQVDLDGSFSYSDVLKVKKNISNNFMVARMSSPSTNKEFTATLDVFKEGEMQYELRDLEGNIMFSLVQPMVNGLNDITINLVDQKPNLYKLIFKFGKEEESLVIEKTLDEIEKKQNMATNPLKIGRQ